MMSSICLTRSIFESAADTTVLQGHETVVLGIDDTATLNEVGVDVDLAYIIDNYRKLYAAAV